MHILGDILVLHNFERKRTTVSGEECRVVIPKVMRDKLDIRKGHEIEWVRAILREGRYWEVKIRIHR